MLKHGWLDAQLCPPPGSSQGNIKNLSSSRSCISAFSKKTFSTPRKIPHLCLHVIIFVGMDILLGVGQKN